MITLPGQKLRVAVLRGGPSHEYDVSLKTGGHVLSLLRDMPEKYAPLDIFIDKKGVWHFEGRPQTPQDALRHADLVWNGLHGRYGEDGQVQRLLTTLNIPYTGATAVPSVLAMNKEQAKAVYRKHGLHTPHHVLLTLDLHLDSSLFEIFRTFLHPVIVKPANSGSSVGMKIAHTYKELKEAVMHAFDHSHRVLVEEFVRGREATCGVVENFRGEKIYALIPVEIERPKNSIFDYEAKYSGQTKEMCPGSFTSTETKDIEEMARKAHEALGLRHYSRSDFIITPKGKAYILETNSLPGFTTESLLPISIEAVGWNSREFVDHIIKLAL